MDNINICLAILSVVLYVHLWFQRKFTYWARRGVDGPKPTFLFGNVKNVILRKEQFFQPYIDSYYQYKHLPLVGMYCFSDPVLSINDLDLAKNIMIDNFDNFQSHGIFSGGAGDPLAGHLFNMHGQPWKELRTKLASAFSPSKLKSMYPLVENIAEKALEYAEGSYTDNKAINFSEFYEKYSMEIIGSVGFGVVCNGFKNSNSEFYLRGREYFEPTSFYWTVIRSLAFFMPNFFNTLKINRINPDMSNFFRSLVKETVDYRHKNNYRRNDYIQTLIELMQNSLIEEVEVVSNTVLYMVAGYETSATTGQFAAYELALNPVIQDRARDEINRVLAKYDGQLTYEAQNEMTYMNMILDETMRMHPPMRAMFRRCTKDYKSTGSKIHIEKGTLIFIPIHAVQMDPQVFPDPEKFDPERFSPINKSQMHPCVWMPFGQGPRKCLGLRQGYVQTKLALVKILHKYELLLDERMQGPLKMKAAALACAAEDGLWIRLKKLSA